MTTVYTDGACLGNPGPGGWAWAVPDGPFRSGADGATTNQRMEVRAALEAVGSLAGKLEVVSDSTYVVNCFRDRWWEGWLARGWRNAAKQPVANRDLWEPLIDAVRSDPGRVRFRWVKGHSGDPMNDLVDRLAVEAATTRSGRQGDGPPTRLGPADAPSRSPSRGGVAAPDLRVPDGHRLVVAGVGPPGMGGYEDNPAARAARAWLDALLALQAKEHPDLHVLTGLGLGAERLGADAALDAGIGFTAVLAFPDQDRRWPAAARRRHRQLLEKAAGHVLLQRTVPGSPTAVGAALARRDDWLARQSHQAAVIWNGGPGRVARQVRSLQDHLGDQAVWVFAPPVEPPAALF
ncbi:MAG: ribonuclease H family protein [Acidimicrobiales bacterium]